MPKAVIYFDGSCDNAVTGPKIMGCACTGFIDGKKHTAKLRNAGKGTSNQAEYLSLILALTLAVEYVKKYKVEKVTVFGDSQLVVNQFNDEWEVKQPELKKLHEQATEIAGKIGKAFTGVYWLRRVHNEVTDEYSKEANYKLNVDETKTYNGF